MLKKIKKKIQKKIINILGINKIYEIQKNNAVNIGRIKSDHNKNKNITNINEAEFKVFSQFGDDGIIDYIINNISIKHKIFVEFGVENYEESNTKFLLLSQNWQGFILDSSKEYINEIKHQDYYWKYNLHAKESFITVDNINKLLKEFKLPKEIGLLSIDIDGNDFWIWEAIDEISPTIVIIEYNARFGSTESVTIPYRHDFNRKQNENFKNIYYGSSLAALEKLGERKGYSLIFTNSNGNNAYFLKNEKLPNNHKVLCRKNAQSAFTLNSFKEFMDNKKHQKIHNRIKESEYLKKLPLVKI